MSQEHKNQSEGAPTGQIWDNLSFNICNELWHIESFFLGPWIHGDIQKSRETLQKPVNEVEGMIELGKLPCTILQCTNPLH